VRLIFLNYLYPTKSRVCLQPPLEDAQLVIARPAATNSTRINTFAFIFVVFKIKNKHCWVGSEQQIRPVQRNYGVLKRKKNGDLKRIAERYGQRNNNIFIDASTLPKILE